MLLRCAIRLAVDTSVVQAYRCRWVAPGGECAPRRPPRVAWGNERGAGNASSAQGDGSGSAPRPPLKVAGPGADVLTMAGSLLPSQASETSRRDREQACRDRAKPLGLLVYKTRGRYMLQRRRSNVIIEWPLTIDQLEEKLTRLAGEDTVPVR